MKFISEYRDKEKALSIASHIKEISGERQMTFMEVCGTHTMAIARFGIKKLLPRNIDLISGPGCPVCVTPNDYLDHAIALAKEKNVVITTFGDMMRVPGSSSSLEKEHSNGCDIRIVYSALDALEIAKQNTSKEVVFLGIGFETTTPTIAATIQLAISQGIKNFSVLCAHKTVPSALEALLSTDVKIDGFLLPGHVSTIIGANAYRPLFSKHTIGGVIAGFEPTDILEAILKLSEQFVNNNFKLHTSYVRAVTEDGNKKAMAIMSEIFEPCDSNWRGLGTIPGSGLRIKKQFAEFDAAKRFDVKLAPAKEPSGCRCGEILCGKIKPVECPLFGNSCTTENPIGACMVSSEGTCAAYFKYNE